MTVWRRHFGVDVLAPEGFGADTLWCRDVLAPRRFDADVLAPKFWRHGAFLFIDELLKPYINHHFKVCIACIGFDRILYEGGRRNIIAANLFCLHGTPGDFFVREHNSKILFVSPVCACTLHW